MMAQGKPPLYRLSDPIVVMREVCSQAPPVLPDTWSPVFRSFVDRCLQKDPAQRADCTELLRHSFITGLDASAESKSRSQAVLLEQENSQLRLRYEAQVKLAQDRLAQMSNSLSAQRGPAAALAFTDHVLSLTADLEKFIEKKAQIAQ